MRSKRSAMIRTGALTDCLRWTRFVKSIISTARERLDAQRFKKTRAHKLQRADQAVVVQRDVGRGMTDSGAQIPERLFAAQFAEHRDVLRKRLRMVASKQTQKRCLPRPVRPGDGPVFAGFHRPT